MKTVRNKQRLYLISIIFVFILMLISSIIIMLSENELSVSLMYVALILLLSTILLFFLKKQLDHYTFKYQHLSLFSTLESAVKFETPILSEDFLKKIISRGYIHFQSNAHLSLYYKFDYIPYKHKRNKTAVLILLIHNEKYTFSSKEIINLINRFEDIHQPKEQFFHHVIMQFKQTNSSLTKEKIEETHNISYQNIGKRNFLILINAYYSLESHTLSFVHSKTYSPNAYYQYGVTEILTLTK
ncbi:MAG: hypothetical protein GX312_00875 [Candidatus Phytoplasma sp.]|nr:hypothetical protein [Phytoplasma sp.]